MLILLTNSYMKSICSNTANLLMVFIHFCVCQISFHMSVCYSKCEAANFRFRMGEFVD